MAEPVVFASIILPSAICCAASLVDHSEPSNLPDSINTFFLVGTPSSSLEPEDRQPYTVASSIKNPSATSVQVRRLHAFVSQGDLGAAP